MTTSAGIQRDVALKIARWLISKERSEEALALLCVGAVSGPNDPAGQELLAEALRLVPNSPIAKAAFERMEGGAGTAGDHAALDEAIKRFGPAEIEKLEKERSRPQFMRAQVGFNNNVKYKDRVYHVQTEDSGLKMPHIITHCFADGGRVIKSHKRSYAEHAERPDAPAFVRSWMKAQHMEMVLALREGKFDEIIAGKAKGGLTTFTDAPQVDMQQLATRRAKGKEGAHAESVAPPPVPAPIEPTKSAPVRFRLKVIRSLVQGPAQYEPPGDDVVIGASGNVPLTGERFCHPSEGIFYFKHGELFLEDLEGGNGLFIRIRRPVELEPGDEFIVGDQLLRVERNPARDDGPGPGPTYMWFSPHPPSAFRVVQILEGGAIGAVRLAGGTTLQIGRNEGDFTFPKDPFVADRHCFAEEQAGVIVLTDLGSKWGVFVRIRGEQKILHGDELLVGRTRLRVELPEFAGDPQL